jgi:hypothetical protein
MNFIRKIAQNQVDEETHNAFVRYSLGEFEKEDYVIKVTGKNLKIGGGFEWVNVLLKFTCSLCEGEVELSGAIPTMKEITPILDKYGVQYEAKRRYGKSGTKYELKATMPAGKALEMLQELSNNYLLINLKSEGRTVKIKKMETPKPGGLVPKFVLVTLKKEDADKVRQEFLFDIDVGDFKEAIINHTYKITDINVDEALLEQDPARARKEAKRKGIIYRKVVVDGNEYKKEYNFEV